MSLSLLAVSDNDDRYYQVHRVLNIDDTCLNVEEEEGSKRDPITFDSIQHPAYYEPTTRLCFNANTLNDMAKEQKNFIHGTSRAFRNPPHHDFEKLEERFHSSVMKGHAREVDFLLKMGADVNQANEHGNTPLSHAANKGHEAVVNLLLNAGAEVNKADTRLDWTPLTHAASRGHEAVVKMLLEAGAKVNKADKNGWTPLMLAAENSHEAVVKMLLEAGANVNQADDEGWTPLMLAAENGHEAVVRALLDAEADVNKADNKGWTALMMATHVGELTVVKTLLDATSLDVESSGWSISGT